MAKKNYTIPVLMDLEPGDDPIIVIGGSQGTIGQDDQFTFSGIDDETLDLIYANCDDIDFAEMDTNGDLVITLAEFQAWFDTHQPW